MSSLDTRLAALERVLPPLEVAMKRPLIEEILDLKRERNAAILAHNYMTPDIFHTVADFVGDSLALAQRARDFDVERIVMCGVHFMAETVKSLNPERRVLLPDLRAGCSLAASITGADVRALKARYPGVPVVVYVNTTADVKAEADICCTSANAVAVVESLGVARVIFLPDEHLGRHVQAHTGVELILWNGACEVHERFTGAEIIAFRDQHPGARVLAHPECPTDVLAVADFVGSTQAMISEVKTLKSAKVVLITECSMADNIAVEVPEVELLRPCNLCPHMQRITLENIRDALLYDRYPVEVPAELAASARKAIDAMLRVGRRELQAA